MGEEKRFYVLIADDKTWNIALKKKVFGFSDKCKGLWNTIQLDEFVAFYATSPIKKIIGFGKITDKFVDTSLIFPDELFFKKPIWTYRIHVEPIAIQKEWKNGISVPSNIILNVARKVIHRNQFFSFVDEADSNWNLNIHKKIEII